MHQAVNKASHRTMALDLRGRRFGEIRDRSVSFREAKAGHSLAWKFFLAIISAGAITVSALMAVLSATVLAQACIVTGRFSVVSVAIVSLVQALSLLITTAIGISRTYIVLVSSVFVVSLLLYLFNTSEKFDAVILCLALAAGAFFSLVGIIVIAQCITFSLLACTPKGSFFALCTSFLASVTLTWAAVNVLQTEVSGNFSLTVTLLVSTLITAFIIAKRALAEKQKFRWLMPRAVFWAAMGGTSFKGLDLSELDFTGAMLANTDLRAKKLYRTCLRAVKGLKYARVNNAYLDLDNLKVQGLLINGYSDDLDFRKLNLRGAYLQDANLQHFRLSETNLNGADLRHADLRESILLRTILTDADLSSADLTGACIKDWSFNQQTCFDNITCDYIYREYENGCPSDRYPPDRHFEVGEFQSLFQKLTNAVELVFKEQVDWRSLSFAFEKFRIEDDGLDLELKGVEQRGDYWVVKVTHREGISRRLVEQQVHSTYEDIRGLLESKDRQINQLLGIVDNQTQAMNQQAEALTNFSKQPFGNHFFISGSTITNLAGSGQIEYREAADRVRRIVTNRAEASPTMQQLFSQLGAQNVATTAATQQELIQQILLSEAEQDPAFRQFLLEQGQQIIGSLPSGEMAITLQGAIAQL
jgi:uncharacterized protein YjbI with pentapeptide repeats